GQLFPRLSGPVELRRVLSPAAAALVGDHRGRDCRPRGAHLRAVHLRASAAGRALAGAYPGLARARGRACGFYARARHGAGAVGHGRAVRDRPLCGRGRHLARIGARTARMIALLTDPQAWAALLTLSTLEIVLGIDNVVFISVLVARLDPAQGRQARQIGLTL